MKRRVKLTESDLHNIIKKSVKKALNEIDGLTYRQIKNITGIEDDDEFNAAAQAEDHEEIASYIWSDLTDMSNGVNPKRYSYSFQEICDLLSGNYNAKYVGADDRNQCHVFKNKDFTVDIFPDTFYTKQGLMSVVNLNVY